jgi:hypothetical protein
MEPSAMVMVRWAGRTVGRRQIAREKSPYGVVPTLGARFGFDVLINIPQLANRSLITEWRQHIRDETEDWHNLRFIINGSYAERI